jgi:hypothetical protein
MSVCLFASTHWTILFLAGFILWDVAGSALSDIVSALLYRGVVLVRNTTRWLLMQLLHLLMVIVAFAWLFLFYGFQFEPPIREPVTALYQSLLTFTTLGYGEIIPREGCSDAKVLVILELLFFLGFLAIKLPAAVAAVHIKKYEGR